MHTYLFCGALALAAATARVASGEPAAPPLHDGQSDFDFLVGTWKVKNRVLDGWLKGSTTWYEFDAIAIERPIWGGRGIVEEWDGTSPKRHIQGLSVRLYDPAARH